jgi:hypothetical protein
VALPTELWVTAHLRICDVKNIPVYVRHRGDSVSGIVMVKIIINPQTCKLYSQNRDIDGNMGWLDIFAGEILDETRADLYIERTIQRDPDMWVIEVEDKNGINPFEGKIF